MLEAAVRNSGFENLVDDTLYVEEVAVY